MFSNLNKVMNEKMKTFQQQIRKQDERIVSLETENAMLYLKLAQCQGQLRTTKQETSYHQQVSQEEREFRSNMKEKLLSADRELKDMKNELEATKSLFKNFFTNFKADIANLTSEEKLSPNVNTTELQAKLLRAELERDEAERRSYMERDRRKTLHNTLVELRGNIRVHCRVRPLIADLDSNSVDTNLGTPGTQSEQIVDVLDEETVLFTGSNKSRSFEYERVYKPSDDQDCVFNDVAPLLTSLLDGYNVCIMAYGQTGSGKTHTMVGDHAIYNDVSLDGLFEERKQGIIPRAAKELIRLMKERESGNETSSLEISVFEVYNNEIIDLLADNDQRNIKHVVFSASDGSQEIPTLTTKKIFSTKDVMNYVTYGMSRRHEDGTNVHAHSSRSHLIVQINVYQTNTQQQPTSTCQDGSKDLGTSASENRNSTPVRSRSPAGKRSKSPIPVRRTNRPLTPNKKSQSTHEMGSSNPNQSNVMKLCTKTKLQLVDLAGNECVGMSGVTGSALRETSNINKSLSALADVLQALSENQNHIPYRNTKLTHILQDTIGGDSKLLVMLCVSPVQKYTTETLQCLGFGSRTRQVARGPAKKRRPTGFNLTLPNDSISVRSSTPLSHSSSTKR